MVRERERVRCVLRLTGDGASCLLGHGGLYHLLSFPVMTGDRWCLCLVWRLLRDVDSREFYQRVNFIFTYIHHCTSCLYCDTVLYYGLPYTIWQAIM